MTIYRRNLINYWRQFFPEWDIPKGYHVHHIKPVCEGGTHDAKNLIALHPDDHAAIHRCRGDIHITQDFLLVANRKQSEDERKMRSEMTKKDWEKRKSGLLGDYEEMRYRMSISSTGKKHSKETIDKIKNAMKGKHSGKNNPMYGKKLSTEAIEKLKRRIECPHCDKVGSISNMKRWHFDNCKEIRL